MVLYYNRGIEEEGVLLMLLSTSDDLQQKTMAYWTISQAWNNRSEIGVMACDAIRTCNDNLTYTNPSRPIFRHTNILLDEIIKGEGSPKPDESKVINFPDIAAAL
jgi:hypothetical protein